MATLAGRGRRPALLALLMVACAPAAPGDNLQSSAPAEGAGDADAERDSARAARLLTEPPLPPPSPTLGDRPAVQATLAHDGGLPAVLEAGGREAAVLEAGGRESAVLEAGGREAAVLEAGGREAADSGSGQRDSASSACAPACVAVAPHLLISEVAFRPAAAEMIEVWNPTSTTIELSDYLLSDSELYHRANESLAGLRASDFVARFPSGARMAPGQYITVALANASGGSASFQLAYDRLPDFELRPTAHGATDDPEVPNMLGAAGSETIGASTSFTDEGEPVVLFQVDGSGLVRDIDQVFFGRPSDANPSTDRADAGAHGSDGARAAQVSVPLGSDSVTVHRCRGAELAGRDAQASAPVGEDQSSVVTSAAFAASRVPTPGAPPPEGICAMP